MNGIDMHVLLGTMVADPQLRKNGSGTSYCYFRLAVNYTRKAGDGSREKAVKYFDCSASKGAATYICQAAHKGDIVAFRATMRFKDPKTVEKDGVKTIYRDVIFDVAGDLQVINRGPKAADQEDAEFPESPTPATALEQQTGTCEEPEIDLTAEEEDIVGQLPF